MRGFSRVLGAEVYKARYRRSTWALPISAAAVTAMVFFAVDYAAGRDWIGVPGGWYLASSTTGWMIDITGLIAIVMTCFAVSGEFSRGTVKPALTRGISRGGWYAGRVVAVCAATTVLLAAVMLTALALAGTLRSLSDLLEKDFLIHSSADLFRGFVLCSALTLAVLWAVVSAAAMVSSLVGRAGSAIALAIFLAAGMTVLSVFDPLRPFLLGDALGLPMAQMISMSKGLPLPLEWSSLARRTLLCAAGWTAATCALGILVMRRKEITF